MDAFTAKEYASYYIKVLDEHLPLAMDILADIVRNPAFSAEDIEREKKVVVEEIKMVEDTPDDLVHELFTAGLLGEPSARPADPRHPGDGRVVQRGRAARLLHAGLHARRNLIVVGGRQPRARAGPRARRREVRVAAADGAAARRARAAGRARRS